LEEVMKRTTLAIVSLSLLLGVSHAAADTVSDRDMANRYFQAAQAGDDNAQFYLAAPANRAPTRKQPIGCPAPPTRATRTRCSF
jgi:hypothetical protein